jgi:nucleoid-associated protein YgaU
MPRLRHGAAVSIEEVQGAQAALANLSVQTLLGFAVTPPLDLHDFDFLFPSLQGDPNNLLPEQVETLEHLKQLGRTMEDPGSSDPGDSAIPAVYTYFGQFVDHDITLETQSGSMGDILDVNMIPLPLAEIRDVLRNTRTATLDLDSLYGNPAPRDPNNSAKMLIGQVTELHSPDPPFSRPPGKGLDNDLPREAPNPGDTSHDRAALIGDPRNDENLIVGQMHLALLKAHNKLVDQGRSFEEARRILRQHYQHIVINDYLKRICKPEVVDDILQNGNKVFNALAEPFFMPFEFSVAAFRFGHTMIRGAYNFNVNFNEHSGPPIRPATLGLLFTFTALTGQLGGTDTLPENWIIQWENIVDTGTGAPFDKSRRFDTKLAGRSSDDPGVALALFRLQDLVGQMEQPPDAARLSVRNLLRGYRLRMPTGQAVANFLGLPIMAPSDIENAASSPEQVQALQAGGFLDRTPLWYYILAEAKHEEDGERLGTLGSTIVAEVLIGLVLRSEDSILRQPGWSPSLPGVQPGTFELADLLRFAEVLSGGPTTRTYTVQSGDTLSSIAEQQLGDAARWPEIFALNRAVVRHPDLIFPGQVLILPPVGSAQPAPRFYAVQPGDTLSSIAQQQLGDGDRWPEIFDLNRDVISNPDIIFPSQVLVLPG